MNILKMLRTEIKEAKTGVEMLKDNKALEESVRVEMLSYNQGWRDGLVYLNEIVNEAIEIDCVKMREQYLKLKCSKEAVMPTIEEQFKKSKESRKCIN